MLRETLKKDRFTVEMTVFYHARAFYLGSFDEIYTSISPNTSSKQYFAHTHD